MQKLPAGALNLLRFPKNLRKMRPRCKILRVTLDFIRESKTILRPEFSIQSLHISGFMKNFYNDVTPAFIKLSKLGAEANDKRGETWRF